MDYIFSLLGSVVLFDTYKKKAQLTPIVDFERPALEAIISYSPTVTHLGACIICSTKKDMVCRRLQM